MLPAVDADAAAAIAERARQAVSRLTADDPAPVTISIGVATMPGDASDKNELIAAADIALYHGKQSGGDRVTRASEVPGEMRDLRDSLDRSARTALLRPQDAGPGAEAEPCTRGSGTPIISTDAGVIDALLALAHSLTCETRRDAATPTGLRSSRAGWRTSRHPCPAAGRDRAGRSMALARHGRHHRARVDPLAAPCGSPRPAALGSA